MRLFKQTQNPESLKDQVIRILSEDNLRFSIMRESDSQTIINLGMALNSGNVDTFIDLQTDLRLIEIVTFTPINIPENKRDEVARYFNLIALSLSYGHFEIDPSTGRFRCKTYLILTEGQNSPDEVIIRCFYSNVNVMDKYFPGLMQIVFGNLTAKRAIEKMHSDIDPQLN
jgi:hypothetical protein